MKFIWLLTLLLLSVSCSNNDFILNSQLKLGNCTDVSNDDFNSRFKLFDEFDSNLKKFFYSDYKFGSINITNVFSVAGANYTHQKIEYYNSASSVLAYIRDVDFRSQDHENSESQNIYIGFGRINSISSAFEYDIIINIHKDQIQPVDAHNTEFELSSNQAKITYRSALQNLLTDVMPKEFRLSMKVRNTIYPSVSLSAVINMDSTGENFTAIEVNMVQDIPNVSSFIYYPVVIIMFLSFCFLVSLIMESYDMLRYYSTPLQRIVQIIHCYYIAVVVELISGYLSEYYGYFVLLKICSVGTGFLMLFTILYLTIMFSDSYIPFIRYGPCILIFFMIFHILTFYYFLYDFFCIYIMPNLWVYSIVTNFWVAKFMLNVVFKSKYSIVWPMNIFISVIMCFLKMQYFDINASSNYFNLSYVLVLLTIHFAFIALLVIQAISGSRFFLPDNMRTRVYEKMIRKIEASSSENTLCCQLCTNLLDQPELEYADNDFEYKRVYLPLGYYIQTDCLHIFHPNCILKSVSKSQICPVCNFYLNICGYEDGL